MKDPNYVPDEDFDRARRNDPRPMATDRRAWHRQPNESAVAYQAFMLFLMAGEKRRLQDAITQTNKSHSLISKWSRKWNWSMRAAAYEEHYLLVRLESVEADRDQMFTAHKQLARQALDVVEQSIMAKARRLQVAVEQGDAAPEVLRDEALVRLFDVAIKAERMAILGRSESAEKAQERQEKLADQFSDELATLMQDVMDTAEMTEEQKDKAKLALARHFAH